MDNLDDVLPKPPEPFQIKGKEYTANRFQVAHYADLRQCLDVVAEVIERAPTVEIQISILLCEALKEVCVLIACGTSMQPEDIVELDPDEFMTVLALVMDVNASFFRLAAAERRHLQAAKR